MRGLILVLATPYFVTTDESGHFRLSGLPSGHYTLKVGSIAAHSRASCRSEKRLDSSRRFSCDPLSDEGKSQAASFRAKLLIAMMLLVAGLTATGLYLAQRNAMADLRRICNAPSNPT